MAKETRAVIVDTYAIIADLLGQASRRAYSVMDSIRLGDVDGLIHFLIVYELSYHWRKGRLPFHDLDEIREFIDTYFRWIDIDREIALYASEIKILGDRILRESGINNLRRRRLSICDATSIALAKAYNVPIVSGDSDLSFVARSLGIEVVW